MKTSKRIQKSRKSINNADELILKIQKTINKANKSLNILT